MVKSKFWNFFWCSFLKKIFFGHQYIILAMLTLESKVNFLFFLLLHFLVVCVALTFSYPLSFAQVSLDCATLGCQINWWRASAAAIRNMNGEKNYQVWIELEETSKIHFRLTQILSYIKCSVSFMFCKGVWNGRDFDKNSFILGTKLNVLKNFLLRVEREVQFPWEHLFFFVASVFRVS